MKQRGRLRPGARTRSATTQAATQAAPGSRPFCGQYRTTGSVRPGISGGPSFDVLETAVVSRPNSQSACSSDGPRLVAVLSTGADHGVHAHPTAVQGDTDNVPSCMTQTRLLARRIPSSHDRVRPRSWAGYQTDPAGIRTLPRMLLHQTPQGPVSRLRRSGEARAPDLEFAFNSVNAAGGEVRLGQRLDLHR